MQVRVRLLAQWRQQGLSLVELMVALAISTVLALGIGQVFIAGKKSYNVNQALSRIQEDTRFASSRIKNSLRSAGAGATLQSIPDNTAMHLGTSLNELDKIATVSIVGSDGIDANNASVHSASSTFDIGGDEFDLASFPSGSSNKRDDNADALSFVSMKPVAGGHVDKCRIPSSKNSGESANIKLAEDSSGDCPTIHGNQMLVMSNSQYTDLFQRNNNPSANTNINIQDPGVGASEKIDFSRYFDSGGTAESNPPVLYGLVQTQYYVQTADTATCGRRALVRREIPLDYNAAASPSEIEANTANASTQTLICGVPTLQLTYGISDGSEIRRYDNARDVDFASDRVGSVKVTLLIRGKDSITDVDARTTIDWIDSADGSGTPQDGEWPDKGLEPAVPEGVISRKHQFTVVLRKSQTVL